MMKWELFGRIEWKEVDVSRQKRAKDIIALSKVFERTERFIYVRGGCLKLTEGYIYYSGKGRSFRRLNPPAGHDGRRPGARSSGNACYVLRWHGSPLF